MGKLIQNIPLFFVILVVYNIVTALFNDPGNLVMDRLVYEVFLPSDTYWAIYMRDVFLLCGLVVLFIEIVKSTTTSTSVIIDHSLSIVVFIAYMLEFLLTPMVAESTFVLIGFMSFLDVIAGFTISITASRRDISIS